MIIYQWRWEVIFNRVFIYFPIIYAQPQVTIFLPNQYNRTCVWGDAFSNYTFFIVIIVNHPRWRLILICWHAPIRAWKLLSCSCFKHILSLPKRFPPNTPYSDIHLVKSFKLVIVLYGMLIFKFGSLSNWSVQSI